MTVTATEELTTTSTIVQENTPGQDARVKAFMEIRARAKTLQSGWKAAIRRLLQRRFKEETADPAIAGRAFLHAQVDELCDEIALYRRTPRNLTATQSETKTITGISGVSMPFTSMHEMLITGVDANQMLKNLVEYVDIE